MQALTILKGPLLKVFHYVRELPLLWFLAGCLIARAVLWIVSLRFPQVRSSGLKRIALGAALLVIFIYLVIALYSLHSYVLQPDDPNILSIAAVIFHGSIYQAPGSPDGSYSLMYGPITYFIYRIVLMAGGWAHCEVLRGAIVLANIALCTVLYLVLRKIVSATTAITLLALPASLLLQHPEIGLGNRSDIWVFLLTALTILCSFLDSEVPAVILTGLIGGMIVDCKITGGPAILFPLLMIYRRFGFRALAISTSIATAVAFAPFAVPGVSLHNYLAWIAYMRAEGITPGILWPNIIFALFLISPCLLMEYCAGTSAEAFKRRLPDLSIILFCLSLGIMTSKPGSGPWYFWHIIPSITVYLAFVSRDAANTPGREAAVPIYYIAASCMLLTFANFPRARDTITSSLMPASVGPTRKEITRYMDIYKDRSSIQMGYGSTVEDPRTGLRYVLVYKGQPYELDGNTERFETLLLPFPINVLKKMDTCKDDVWLIPHAQKPFDIYLFPDLLRQTFLQNYRLDRSDEMLDAWTCSHATAQ